MKLKGKQALLAGLVLLLCIVTACSSKNSGTNGEQPADGNVGGSGQAIELNVWGNPSLDWDTNMAEDNQAIYQYIQSEMEKKFPGIKINYINKGWADELRQNIMLAVMGGNTPDVAMGEDFVPEFAQIGALVEVPDELAAGLAEGPLRGAMYGGKRYAVSGMTGVFGLIYNRDVLRKAGLDADTPPTTWEEWLEMSKKITEAGNGAYHGSVVQDMGLGGTFRIVPFMRQAGGDLTTADWSQVTFNSPENVKALTFLRELSKTAPKGSTSMTDEGAMYNMIHHGKVAFGVAGPWHISWAKSEGCDCGYARLPRPDADTAGNVIVGNVLWFALKQSKNHTASLEFLRIMASKEYQEMTALGSARLPSNIEAGSSPALAEAYPDMKLYSDIVATESPAPLPIYAKEAPRVREVWYKAQSDILQTDKDIAAILAAAQKEAEELLQ